MQTSTGYVNDIIPPYAEWESRGNQFFHPDTGSSLSYPIFYCKDIKGCGVKNYRNVSAVTTINFLDGCTPRLNAVLSVQGLLYENATEAQMGHLWAFVMGGQSLLPTGTQEQRTFSAAALTCGD